MRRKNYIFIVPGRAYAPRSNHASKYKQVIKTIASGHIRKPLDGEIAVKIEYVYRSSKNRLDGDNLLKIVCDALTGIAYVDDSQISHHEISLYHINSSFTIKGVPLTEDVIDCFSQEAFVIIRLRVSE